MSDESVQPTRQGMHSWRPMNAGYYPRHCEYCLVPKDQHAVPPPGVIAGGTALRKMWPGWLTDGGGIYAVQDSEVAAHAVLTAAALATEDE
jgi:hypothetical protein